MSSIENQTTIPQIPPIPQVTPGEKTMKWWYQAKLAERLVQAMSMEKNRILLRRGAQKMQDGTLGQVGEPEEEEPMNISIGDTYQVMPAQPSQPVVSTPTPTVSTPEVSTPVAPTVSTSVSPSNGPSKVTVAGILAAVLAAVLASGVVGTGVAWLAGAFDKTPVTPPTTVTTVTPPTTANQFDYRWRELQLGKARPTNPAEEK